MSFLENNLGHHMENGYEIHPNCLFSAEGQSPEYFGVEFFQYAKTQLLSQLSTSLIYCPAYGRFKNVLYVNMCGGCMQETVFGPRLKYGTRDPIQEMRPAEQRQKDLFRKM